MFSKQKFTTKIRVSPLNINLLSRLFWGGYFWGGYFWGDISEEDISKKNISEEAISKEDVSEEDISEDMSEDGISEGNISERIFQSLTSLRRLPDEEVWGGNSFLALKDFTI